jgi:phosphoglucosamine mutase
LLAALQVLAVVVQSGRSVSEVCHLFDPYPQLLKNIRFSTGAPLEDNRVQASIADAERRLGNRGRLVIRKSGTEPLIRVMAEADDMALVQEVVDSVCVALQRAA